MSSDGYFQIEIYDVDARNGINTQGSIELLSFDCIQQAPALSYPVANFETVSLAPYNYAKPILVRGRGPSLGANYVTNPAIEIKWDNGNFDVFNDDWGSFYDPSLISNSPYPLSNPLESAYFYFATGGIVQDVYYQSSSSSIGLRGILDIYSLTGTGYWIPELVMKPSGVQDAWVSYNASTGMLSQTAVGYSVSVLNSVSGTTGDFTAFQFSGSQIVYSGVPQESYCSLVGLTLAQSGQTCVSPPPHTDEEGNPTPVQACVSGALTSGQLTGIISDIVQAYILNQSNQGQSQGQNTDNQISDNPLASTYAQYQGYIKYNHPIVGDSVHFNSYNILGGYTQAYENIFGHAPPWPAIDFVWNFGGDYTDIDTLVSAINIDIGIGSNYELWHNIPCMDNATDGYFENGPLLQAVKIDDNTIALNSLRAEGAGNYLIEVHNVARPTNTALNIVKYLMPGTVQFQASNDNATWTTLDAHSGIDWLSIPPYTEKYTTGVYFNEVSGAYNSSGSNGDGDISITGGPVKTIIYSVTATGKDKCGNPFSQQIDFYQLPSGISSCDDQSPTGSPDNIKIDGLGGAGSTVSGTQVFSQYLKTGWKFTNTTPYNFYRLYFSDFESHGRGWTTQYANEFEIDNINIYGIVTGYNFHSGEICLLGANYNLQIEGLTTGIITGRASGYADASTSGLYDFRNSLVTGVPNSNGVVIFQHASGHAVGAFTGVLGDVLVGTGYYLENVGGYFYNTGLQSIEFVEQVSGFIKGSGNLSGGPYNVIHSDFINTGVTGIKSVVSTQPALVSGGVSGFLLEQNNVPAFSYVSGVITGNVTGTSGYLLYQNLFGLVPSFAYSNLVTGTVSASATLHFNHPQAGDTLFINDTPIIFETGLGFFAPTYYGDITGLNNIINSGTNIYNASSTILNGTTLKLSALPLGQSGNAVNLYSQGSTGASYFDSTNFTGGQTFYDSVNPVGVFTGAISETVYATGLYTGLGTGTLTGTIKNLLFVRHFSGIWDLRTGSVDFNSNGWITGDNTYTSSPFVPNPTFSGDLNALPITVIYRNSPFVNSLDVVTLSITGADYPSGIQLVLSGVF